ncbi:hypothetical protein ABZP36_012137 [Zizania latifolia]
MSSDLDTPMQPPLDDNTTHLIAEELIKNANVQAIIMAPQTSTEECFIARLAKNRIPILSFSSISSTPKVQTPFFVHTAVNDLFQAKPIASIVTHFSWREAILLCEDSPHGIGIFPSLTRELQGKDTRISEAVFVPVDTSDGQLIEMISRLKNMTTRVFIVHMRSNLSARVFAEANCYGMMSEGYAWIATTVLGDVVDSLGAQAINSMEGVVTLRPAVNETNHLVKRLFARLPQNNPSMALLWAYDTAWAIATATETARVSSKMPITGKMLLDSVLKTTFDGLAGKFMLENGVLQQPLSYDILNVVGKGTRTVGTWMLHNSNFNLVNDLTNVPKGWDFLPNGKKLIVAVPMKHGFKELVNVSYNIATDNCTNVTGYFIEFFRCVLNEMGYKGEIKCQPYNISNTSFNDLVEKVHKKEVDVLVGDITITSNRMEKVMFTVPYTQPGWAMMVAVKKDPWKSMWIFEKPFKHDLWIASFFLFCFTGLVVWVIEHRINAEFRGTPLQQLGTTFYFIFSTMVFSHKENLQSNKSRIVVIVWVFFVFILTSSYTANLSSMLTVKQLEPSETDVWKLIRDGHKVGYQEGSFVKDSLMSMGFNESKLVSLSTMEQYNEVLSNGRVSAIFDEIPYLQFFQKRFPNYTMVAPVYKSGGFAFVFQEGSLLGSQVSEAMMKKLELNNTCNTTEILLDVFDAITSFDSKNDNVDSLRLDFIDFSGLILISATLSGLMLLTHFAMFVYQEFHEIRAAAGVPAGTRWWTMPLQTVRALFHHFDTRDSKSKNKVERQVELVIHNGREGANRVPQGDGHQQATVQNLGASAMEMGSSTSRMVANLQSLREPSSSWPRNHLTSRLTKHPI